MNINSKIEYNFPIGFHDFHRQPNLNFQFNRLVTNGGNLEEVKEVATKIEDFNDWKRELIALAEKALAENRLLNSAAYYRAAEFFVSPMILISMFYMINLLNSFTKFMMSYLK